MSLRKFSEVSLNLPWRFNDKTLFRLVPLLPQMHNELMEIQHGFEFAYGNVIKYLAEGDVAHLQKGVEPGLFINLRNGLDTIRRRNWTLSMTNPTSNIRSYFYNERLVKGVHIDRSKNTKDMYELSSLADRLNVQGKRIPPRNIIYYNSGEERNNTLVLKVDVVFYSALKLLLKDERGEVIKGDDNEMGETHMMRFESETERSSGLFPELEANIQALLHYVLGYGRSPLKEYNWTVADIDFSLKGNRFVDSEKTVINYR